MAKVLGESGRYISPESIQKRRKVLAMALMVTAASFSFLGFLVGNLIRKSPLWSHAVCAIAFLVLLRIVFIKLRDNLEKLEDASSKSRNPDSLQGIVGQTVRELPEEYEIIADLMTPFGKLEQVVVGPTGIFVVETKNWKGMVSTDGKGELLWNGHPTDRPFVQEFADRLKEVGRQLERLIPGVDVRIQGLFVFTAAGIEANLSNETHVCFVRGDQLSSRILASTSDKHLNPQKVDAIANSVLQMAQINAESSDGSKEEMPAARRS